MRIGLYGMPTAGKSYLLDRIDFLEVISGSRLLRQLDPDFDKRDEPGREKARKYLARTMMEKDNFIMDGHYAFGDEIAFTEEDGQIYDVFLYIYTDPDILATRMNLSEKNRKYLKYDLCQWQKREIEGLREYCHKQSKDIYILDNPPRNEFCDVDCALEFLNDIVKGYSCVGFAKKCARDILPACHGKEVVLLDGDKTLTLEDSSNKVFGYRTDIFDGNFYSGYQAWKQDREFHKYIIPEISNMPVRLNDKVLSSLTEPAFILTSGHGTVWGYISEALGIGCFYGREMSAETKYFVTRLLQEAGIRVKAYGDSLIDYYMLKQADHGFLVAKTDGRISRSLKEKNLEGLEII